MNRARFSKIPWFKKVKDTPVTIIGAGGIGSWTAMLMKRAGFDLTVIDYDRVESVNLGGQLFAEKHIDQYKVDALNEVIKDFVGEEIKPINFSFIEEFSNKNMIMAVDNMATRKEIFENWKMRFGKDETAWLIDGRLEAEDFQVHIVKGGDKESIKKYEEGLFQDEESFVPSCSRKQTSHIAAMIGGMITNIATSLLDENREVPEKVIFDGFINTMETH